MQHIRIATYGINNGTFPEIAEKAQNEMLPKFQEQPGFIRYGLAATGDKECTSISVWETREHAEAAMPVAEAWVSESLADRVELRGTSVSELAFFKGVAQNTPATV